MDPLSNFMPCPESINVPPCESHNDGEGSSMNEILDKLHVWGTQFAFFFKVWNIKSLETPHSLLFIRKSL